MKETEKIQSASDSTRKNDPQNEYYKLKHQLRFERAVLMVL